MFAEWTECPVMPIVDVTLVLPQEAPVPKGVASSLATQIGRALKAEPGRVWVRLHVLGMDRYAENESTIGEDELPVFVTVLHARTPTGENLAVEVAALVHAVATCLNRQTENVHIEYAPAGVGRIAFGGRLVQ